MTTLRTLLQPHRSWLWGSAALSSLAALLEFAPPLLVYCIALDLSSVPSRTDRLFAWGLLALLAVTLRYLLQGAALICSHAVAFRLLREGRSQIAHHLARYPDERVRQLSPGELKKTMLEDVAALESVIAHNLPDLASALLVPSVAWLGLLSINWRLALLSVALLPLALGIQAFAMRNVGEQVQSWHEAERRASTALLEFVRGIATLKTFDRDASSLSEVRAGIYGVRDLGVLMSRRSSYAYMAFFVLLSSNLLLLLPVGLHLHASGSVSTPELVLALLLGFAVTSPLLKLLFLFGDLQMNAQRWERVRSLLSPESTPTASSSLLEEPPSPTVPACEFYDVTFHYSPERPAVFSRLSFQIPQGGTTAIVGPSGSGKSTLLRLLSSSNALTTGSIRILGRELTQPDRENWAKLVTLVSQESLLFHGSLRDNLLLARPEATQAELDAAAQAAGLSELLQQLPQGWDTAVGERGARLSGGEVQRVAIARALLQKSSLVLLDEVTAHLDPEHELAVQRGIAELLRERTVLVVAHRLRTTRTATRILVLSGDGTLADSGTHEELLSRCSIYQTLWHAQERASQWRLGRAHSTEVTHD